MWKEREDDNSLIKSHTLNPINEPSQKIQYHQSRNLFIEPEIRREIWMELTDKSSDCLKCPSAPYLGFSRPRTFRAPIFFSFFIFCNYVSFRWVGIRLRIRFGVLLRLGIRAYCPTTMGREYRADPRLGQSCFVPVVGESFGPPHGSHYMASFCWLVVSGVLIAGQFKLGLRYENDLGRSATGFHTAIAGGFRIKRICGCPWRSEIFQCWVLRYLLRFGNPKLKVYTGGVNEPKDISDARKQRRGGFEETIHS